jgi:Mn-containing catalase
LRSNIAAESRAKIVYERLINLTDDPGVKEALGFLMTREIAHQQQFEKALYSMQPNFPPGKLGRQARVHRTSTSTCRWATATRAAPWNNEPTFEFREAKAAVDGGASGMPEVNWASEELEVATQAAAACSRTRERPDDGCDARHGGSRHVRRGARRLPREPKAAKENAQPIPAGQKKARRRLDAPGSAAARARAR